MKKLLAAVMVVFAAISVGLPNAEAKRMGGGGTFGKQSQSASRPAPTQSSQAASATKPGTPAASSPWKGILGGALLGLGLGALLSHLGLGGALASMISTMLTIALFALAAMFIYRMWRRRSGESGMRPAFATASATVAPQIGSQIQPTHQPVMLNSPHPTSSEGTPAVVPVNIPADFDVQSFVRNAKTYFIRLQAAWDKADTNDIREFTTPEMFAEIKLQLQERGASLNQTDVVTLDAHLLGMETVGGEYLVSVHFSGLIRESENAPAEQFAEIWNLSKPVSGQSGWLLAGIQQPN